MKTCYICGENKDLTNFHKKSSSKDGYEHYCKLCHKDYNRQHYKQNKSKIVKQIRVRQKRQSESFKLWKRTLSCRVCECDYSECIEFHHLDSDSKESTISNMIQTQSFKKIVNELLKCAPVCSNCHRRIHAKTITPILHCLTLDELQELRW